MEKSKRIRSIIYNKNNLFVKAQQPISDITTDDSVTIPVDMSKLDDDEQLDASTQ